MYPPPDQLIIDKLVGCTINVLSFYRIQIGISCEDGNGIMVLCPFCFGRDAEIEPMEWTDFPIALTGMTRVLGSKITNALADKSNHLRIEFSTGDTLLVSWSSMYESYELHIGGERIIV